MSLTYRLILCAAVLLVDLAVFFLPLTALFLIYVILVNPPWFRKFLADSADPQNGPAPSEDGGRKAED